MGISKNCGYADCSFIEPEWRIYASVGTAVGSDNGWSSVRTKSLSEKNAGLLGTNFNEI